MRSASSSFFVFGLPTSFGFEPEPRAEAFAEAAAAALAEAAAAALASARLRPGEAGGEDMGKLQAGRRKNELARPLDKKQVMRGSRVGATG